VNVVTPEAEDIIEMLEDTAMISTVRMIYNSLADKESGEKEKEKEKAKDKEKSSDYEELLSRPPLTLSDWIHQNAHLFL